MSDKKLEAIIPIGTIIRMSPEERATIVAVANLGGERYYFLIGTKTGVVSMLPADVVGSLYYGV